MPEPAAPEAVLDPRRRTLILTAVCAALAAVIASVSGLNIAQQAIALDLGASQGDLLWVVNGYTVALAALLLPIGALGDRWGRKHILTGGLALFVVGNLAASMTTSVEALIAFRVVTGLAAAMIMPATLSIITSSFPADARGRAVGIWAGFAGAGGILGLLLSSFLIDRVTWPWLFIPPVVVAAASLVLTVLYVPNSRESILHRFDVVGSVLSVFAVGGIVLGIQEGPERGWSDPLAMAGLAIGIVALLSFVAWELRLARDDGHPLLDLRIFRERALSAGSLALFVPFMAMFGIMLVLVQFMTAVLGYSAFRSALSLLPMAAVMMGLSPVAPALAARIGARRIMGLGLGLLTAGLFLMAVLVERRTYLSILPGLLVLAAGMGISMTPATTAITGSLPKAQQGVASALNDTVREVGGAIGTVLVVGLSPRHSPAIDGEPVDTVEDDIVEDEVITVSSGMTTA